MTSETLFYLSVWKYKDTNSKIILVGRGHYYKVCIKAQ